jgi:hypothetical protein
MTRHLCTACGTRPAEFHRSECSRCRHNRMAREKLKGETDGVPALHRDHHYSRPYVPVLHCPECADLPWRRNGKCPGCGGMPAPEPPPKLEAPAGVQWDL